MLNIDRWLPLLVIVVLTSPSLAIAQARDLVNELNDARRIFVPVEDLDVIIERDKQGVLLPRAKFDVLLTQARANSEKNAVPAGTPLILAAADYEAEISGDQLLITVTADLMQFEDDWHESRFALQRLSLEQALVDDIPALIGRHPDGSVSLFTDSRGKHSIKLQLSTELTALGSDQVAAFSLLKAPSGTLTLTLPAGKRLLIGNLQLERPAPLDQVAEYRIPVGGTGGLQLRVTDRATENAADSLMFASTGYGLHVIPGEVTWHALTTLQIFGKPVERLSFSVPRRLEIADVDATGLEGWELSDDPDDAQRTNLSLTFGQAFEGSRKISLKGVMAADAGDSWSVPPLRIDNVTSHVGQIVIQYPAGVRLRVEETAGVRRATQAQKAAVDMPDETSNSEEFLRFDIWQPDFLLQMSTQPKERAVQAAVAAVLDVNATGLELQSALTIETHFAPLFELDIHIPAEWQVLSAIRDNQNLKWQLVPLDEVGVNQLRILLDPPLAAETSSQIRLSLRRDVEGWPVESEPLTIDLPELFLPQSSLSEGAFVVRGDDDLELDALELTGLDPYPLKAAYERLRFQSQDTRFSGKLKITRRPSRIAAQTVTFGRIDPQTVHTFIQSVVEVQGGGVRTIQVALPESAGSALRFECPGPRIVEQKANAPQNGERIWTLKFDQRLRGQALIRCDIELPRGDDKTFTVPQCRVVDAERQSSFFAVEAGGEQRLTIVATDANKDPLPEVDPLALPNVYYQPKERIVAVYRAPAPGAVLTLSEQKFEKLPVQTAICPLLEVATILGGTGELQHRATFRLNVVGVQGLHVTFPNDSKLWAALVDDRPIEVRRSGDVYLIPLTSTNLPFGSVPSAAIANPAMGNSERHVLRLFYRSEAAAGSQFGTLAQNPPTLTVESGQRTALPVEVLEQKWTLHYPEETRLIDSHSPLEPSQPLDRTSLLTNWSSELRIPTLASLGWQLLIVVATIGVIALLRAGFQRKRLLMTQFVLALVFCAIAIALLLPAVQQPRYTGGYNAERTKKNAASRAPASPTSEASSREYVQFDALEAAPQSALPGLKDSLTELSDQESDRVDSFKSTYGKRDSSLLPQQSNGSDFSPAPTLAMDGKQLEPQQGNDPNANRRPIQAPETSNRSGRSALLSLAIDFVPPTGSREKSFQYIGADNPPTGIPLVVDYVDRRALGSLRVFLIALVAMSAWLWRKTSISSKIGLATLGLALPLAVLPLAPMSWQAAIDGLFIGTLVASLIWLICGGIRLCQSRFLAHSVKGVALSIALVACFSTESFADDVPPVESAKPVTTSIPTTLIVPFDAGTEPLASERVFLSHDQFRQLYRLANPDQVSKNVAPQPGGVFEALYAAKLVLNEKTPAESVVKVAARFAVKSFVDGQLIVELPVGQVVVIEAKLDGQTAALITSGGCLQVAIPKSGLHVIDLLFEVPAKLSGTTGSFSLPLKPVPAGRLTFELPGQELSVRVNGSSTIFRRVTKEDLPLLEFPIDKGGDVAVSWQPRQAQGAANAVVHVDSIAAITLADAGVYISNGFAARVRQGGIADTLFKLPQTLKLQAVSGPDVGGWELQGDGDDRQLRVIFRRNVTDQTRITIDAFLDSKVETESKVIAVPQIVPRDATNEIGQVAVFAGDQFSIRAEQVESLTQIDGDKFSTQIAVTRPQTAPQLAYRFSKRPFQLTLRATRQESQAHVTSQQAALITLRKQQLTTRLRYNLTGAPRSSVSVILPEKFVLLDAQATGLRDYYVAKQDDGDLLTVELNEPKLGNVEIVVAGFVPRDEVTSSSIVFPQPLEPTHLETAAAIWLDEGFISTLDAFEGWRSTDASSVNDELRAVRPNQAVQFAFTSNSTQPSPITFTTVQSVPRIAANGLSMVTVTDVATVYLLALQWQIDGARTDTLTLITPDWLVGKLDFQGPNVRDATYSDAGNKTTRWIIHLRTPESGNVFITATATLPPAASEVLAPALVFEHDRKPLERQRQYVLLINSSLSQLTSVDPSLTEPVQREDVPVVVNQEFIDQATELVRVKTLNAAPSWSLHKFAQQSSAPASVNVADMTTILSRDGTYRAQAIYTMKNHTRQFLAIKMPEGTELLSVFVAGQPSRAVTTKLDSLKGDSIQLIALPKTSAASLSFPVKIVWRGSLGRLLPKSARLTREEVSVPAPRILSQQDDAEYGIPVARTRWTVYLPEDLDAEPVSSAARHNLNLSDDSDNLYGNAALQEAEELLGYFEQVREGNKRVQSLNNLKQIGVAADNLKELGKALNNYRGRSGDATFSKNKAEVMRRLAEVERIANEEKQKTNSYFANSAIQGPQQGVNSLQAEGLAEGAAIAIGQQNAFNLSNGTAVIANSGQGPGGKTLEDSINFGLSSLSASSSVSSPKDAAKPAVDPSSGKQSGEGPNLNTSRSQLRQSNDANIDQLNSEVTRNRTVIQRYQANTPSGALPNEPNGPSGPQSGDQLSRSGLNRGLISQNGDVNGVFPGNNTLWNFGTIQDGEGQPNSAGMGNDLRFREMGGMGGGMSTFNTNKGDGFSVGGFGKPADGLETPVGLGGLGGVPQAAPPLGWNVELAQQAANDGRGGEQEGRMSRNSRVAPGWKQPGGLSLGIDLPVIGRKLVFTKSGGDPKLSLAVQSRQSIRWGIGLVWSIASLATAIAVLLTLRKSSGLYQLLSLLPIIGAVLGVIGFCVLPTPFNAAAFGLFLISSFIAAFSRRTAMA